MPFYLRDAYVCFVSAAGLIYSMSTFLGMFNSVTVQPVVAAERVVFYRETAASMYSPAPYALATGVAELPYLAAQALIMVCITYWLVREGGRMLERGEEGVAPPGGMPSATLQVSCPKPKAIKRKYLIRWDHLCLWWQSVLVGALLRGACLCLTWLVDVGCHGCRWALRPWPGNSLSTSYSCSCVW